MTIDYTNITIAIAQDAVRAYNNGCYSGGVKNPEIDREALALFRGGLGSTTEQVHEQVRFIGIDYGGAAGFKAAYALVPAIADDISAVRDHYYAVAKNASPVLQRPHSKSVIEELFAPFVKEIHGKRNWLVWAAKFWHFLNPDAFPILDSRVDVFFRTRGRLQSVEKYTFVCGLFRDFAISHAEWLPPLRKTDGGLAWCDNKLWDKMCYGLGELQKGQKS
ncbi:MAG: hypothetical protein O2960_30190 [Verrucomicrobia bacterium]|nr:hypothetical protein [Verrucomicrobiota bacterium]